MMDWTNDEVNRRLNDGTHNFCSANGIMREAEHIRRDIEKEEESRMIARENNKILKSQLSEVEEANKKLENQIKELKKANEKLGIQIKDFRDEAKSSKKRSNISIAIAALSLVVSIVSIVLNFMLR